VACRACGGVPGVRSTVGTGLGGGGLGREST